jgi:hypothetical protein
MGGKKGKGGLVLGDRDGAILYKIAVTTGDKKNAGTDARVSVAALQIIYLSHARVSVCCIGQIMYYKVLNARDDHLLEKCCLSVGLIILEWIIYIHVYIF